MELDEKTTQEIVRAVEKKLPNMALKIDKIYDLIVGTEEMKEMGLIPRVIAIEEALKDFGLLTNHLDSIPDLAKRLLELEITVLGVKRDGIGGMSGKLDRVQKKPERVMNTWVKVVAIIGGSLGVLSTITTAIVILAKMLF